MRFRALTALAGALLLLLFSEPRVTRAEAPGDGCTSAPSPGDVEIERARRLYERSQEGQGRAKLQALISAPDADPQTLIRTGTLFSAQGDHGGAKKAFERALGRTKELLRASDGYPGGKAALEIYASAALIRLGRPEEGLRRYEAVAAQESSHKRWSCHFVAYVRALFDLGKSQEAVRLLEDIIKNAPDKRSLYDEWVRLVWSAGTQEDIERVLNAARSRFPDDVGFIIRQVNWLKRSSQVDKARSVLDAALARGILDRGMLNELLGLISGRERAQVVLSGYRRLVAKNPSSKALQVVLGILLHYIGELEASEQVLSAVGSETKKFSQAQFCMATNLFLLNRGDEALVWIDRLNRGPDPSPKARLYRGLFLLEKDPALTLSALKKYQQEEAGRLAERPGEKKKLANLRAQVEACMKAESGCSDPAATQTILLVAFPDLEKQVRMRRDLPRQQPKGAHDSQRDAPQDAPQDAGAPWLLFALIGALALWVVRRGFGDRDP